MRLTGRLPVNLSFISVNNYETGISRKAGEADVQKCTDVWLIYPKII